MSFCLHENTEITLFHKYIFDRQIQHSEKIQTNEQLMDRALKEIDLLTLALANVADLNDDASKDSLVSREHAKLIDETKQLLREKELSITDWKSQFGVGEIKLTLKGAVFLFRLQSNNYFLDFLFMFGVFYRSSQSRTSPLQI